MFRTKINTIICLEFYCLKETTVSDITVITTNFPVRVFIWVVTRFCSADVLIIVTHSSRVEASNYPNEHGHMDEKRMKEIIIIIIIINYLLLM
jgi:hypothetical protein